MNLAVGLHRAARRVGHAPALIHGHKQIATYREWSDSIARLATGLRHLPGVGLGDRICIWSANHPEYLTTLYACWHAGLCAVPVNAKLHPTELARIVELTNSHLLVVDDERALALSTAAGALPAVQIVSLQSEQFEALQNQHAAKVEEVPPDSPAWIFFTSGTTGRPKGAVLTHRNLMSMSLAYFADYGTVSSRDRMLHAAPLSHGSGLYALPFSMQGAGHVISTAHHFDPLEVVDLINSHGRVTTFMAPTMLNRLITSSSLPSLDREQLHCIIYGGGPMHVEDVRRALAALGPRIAQLYGQGETPMTISYLGCEEHFSNGDFAPAEILRSAGWPRTGVEIRIQSPEGRWLGPNESGEIAVRGDTVMSGYWLDPEATRKTLENGWLHTGDIGALDDAGRLTLLGRCKELIISGGSNIYPREIEEVLLAHPNVQEVAVVGMPDADWGEAVVAHVVVKEPNPPLAADLDAFCLQRIARFKRPRHYVFHAELPKNAAGKIEKIALSQYNEAAKLAPTAHALNS